MGGRIKHQTLFDDLTAHYKPTSGDLKAQARTLVDQYGDLVRNRGFEPTTDELKCCFGVALGRLEKNG